MYLKLDTDNYNKIELYNQLLTNSEAKNNFKALFELQPSLAKRMEEYKDYSDYVFGNHFSKDVIMEKFELKIFSIVGNYKNFAKDYISVDDIEDNLTTEFGELLNKMVYSLYLEFDAEDDEVESSTKEDVYYIVVDDETGEYLGKFSSEKAAYEFGEDSGYDYRVITEKKKNYSDYYRNKYKK